MYPISDELQKWRGKSEKKAIGRDIAAIKPDETKRKLNRKKKAEKERKSFLKKIFQRRISRGKWIQSNATTRYTACVHSRERSHALTIIVTKSKKITKRKKKQTIWTCVYIYRRDLLYVLYRSSIYTDSRSDYLNLPKRRDNSQSVTDTRLLYSRDV